MDIVQWITQRCDETYHKGNWAGRGVLPAVAGISRETAHWRPHPEQHTIAEMVVHMAFWKNAVAAWLAGPWDYAPEKDWPMVPETASGWDEALSSLRIAHNHLIGFVGSLAFDSLSEAVGKSWLWPERQVRRVDLAVDIATHDSYHAAQIFVLRRLFEAKKS